MKTAPPNPSAWQTRRARAITRWYLERFHGTEDDVGVLTMFCDPTKVGAFAVSSQDIASRRPEALFRVLVATTMFQRRQDLQIMRVLRGISPEQALELSSAEALLRLARDHPCPHLATTDTLRERCDLTKHAETKAGVCTVMPGSPCHLKHHTVWLKRYGHFGKVPTSSALAVQEAGASDLDELIRQAAASTDNPREAAMAATAALSRGWRVSQKIAHMYLSMMTNPDLCPSAPGPWRELLDWRQFVVVDSNVDLFLRATGYPGPWTYEARLGFVKELARRVDLSTLDPRLHAYNPRLVQQAIYLFMSATNRRALPSDCSNEPTPPCERCPTGLRGICGRRRSAA